MLLLTAIVTYLPRGQIKSGVMACMDSIATRSAKLQAEISNKQFAVWLAKNEQKLLAQAELQVKEPAPMKKVEPETMREYYARQDQSFVPYEEQLNKAKTFETLGLSRAKVMQYLETKEGQLYLSKLQAADPGASFNEIITRAVGQIASGSTIPEVRIMNSPLIKIVPIGQEASKYSPFFTTREELQNAAKSNRTLADVFGPPLASEAPKYSIFEMTPLKPTEVFVSKVTPATEFAGSIGRSGEAIQFLTPNRSEFSTTKLIGEISN